ncbi:MAG: hypothetical protein ACYDHY_18100 [Acidiferrobacterales bacterium]
MTRRLSQGRGSREHLIDELLEQVLRIATNKGGEDYLRRWWRCGRKGYDAMSDEDLLQEATPLCQDRCRTVSL